MPRGSPLGRPPGGPPWEGTRSSQGGDRGERLWSSREEVPIVMAKNRPIVAGGCLLLCLWLCVLLWEELAFCGRKMHIIMFRIMILIMNVTMPILPIIRHIIVHIIMHVVMPSLPYVLCMLLCLVCLLPCLLLCIFLCILLCLLCLLRQDDAHNYGNTMSMIMLISITVIRYAYDDAYDYGDKLIMLHIMVRICLCVCLLL